MLEQPGHPAGRGEARAEDVRPRTRRSLVIPSYGGVPEDWTHISSWPDASQGQASKAARPGLGTVGEGEVHFAYSSRVHSNLSLPNRTFHTTKLNECDTARLITGGRKQYVTKASSCVRAALKEPAKTKSLGQEAFAYNKSMWTAGEQGEKALIDSLKSVGK